MSALHRAGELCAQDDARAAESLFVDGVVPDAQTAAEEICMEADGTSFSVQHPAPGEPRRLEVRAMCAYERKERHGRKTVRVGVFHHALVGPSNLLWAQGISQMGTVYDLPSIKRVHLGGDGERWCSQAGAFLRGAEVTYHLDPWHIGRAIGGCIPDAGRAAGIARIALRGDVSGSVSLLEECKSEGVGRGERIDAVIGYLRNNEDAIGVAGPSLGTMETDNQHLYGARMDSVPCAWSVEGASRMARVISRRASGRAIPRQTREGSISPGRRDRRERRILDALEKRAPKAPMLKSVGHGYLPPHQVDTRRIGKGKAYALYRGMAAIDRES